MNFFALTAALTCFVATAKAEVSYLCIELDRVSVSAEGRMSPAFPGRELNFTWDGQSFSGDGVFFHKAYEIASTEADGFRAVAVAEGAASSAVARATGATPRLSNTVRSPRSNLRLLHVMWCRRSPD